MFCTNCGSNLGENDSFCRKCGQARKLSSQEDSRSQADETTEIPSFGTILHRRSVQFRYHYTCHEDYAWLGNASTLLIYKNFIVALQGVQARNATADFFENAGLLGGIFALTREAKDKALDRRKYSDDRLNAHYLFLNRKLVWCPRPETEVFQYYERNLVFSKNCSEQVLFRFRSVYGEIKACAITWKTWGPLDPDTILGPIETKLAPTAYSDNVTIVAKDIPRSSMAEFMDTDLTRILA